MGSSRNSGLPRYSFSLSQRALFFLLAILVGVFASLWIGVVVLPPQMIFLVWGALSCVMLGALLVAVARQKGLHRTIVQGKAVVQTQQTLLEALQEKRLAGAALDVFAEEPLAPTSPLWRAPNLLITPHVSGISEHYNRRAIDLFSENLRRYLNGEPLFNRFDLERGY